LFAVAVRLYSPLVHVAAVVIAYWCARVRLSCCASCARFPHRTPPTTMHVCEHARCQLAHAHSAAVNEGAMPHDCLTGVCLTSLVWPRRRLHSIVYLRIHIKAAACR
jgi:hypothetical protein